MRFYCVTKWKEQVIGNQLSHLLFSTPCTAATLFQFVGWYCFMSSYHLEGCFCMYARKAWYYGPFRAFSVFRGLGNTARQRACPWYGGLVGAWKLIFAPPSGPKRESAKKCPSPTSASYPHIEQFSGNLYGSRVLLFYARSKGSPQSPHITLASRVALMIVPQQVQTYLILLFLDFLLLPLMVPSTDKRLALILSSPKVSLIHASPPGPAPLPSIRIYRASQCAAHGSRRWFWISGYGNSRCCLCLGCHEPDYRYGPFHVRVWRPARRWVGQGTRRNDWFPGISRRWRSSFHWYCTSHKPRALRPGIRWSP